MKERPILFNSAMVRALLDSSKTQTRRTLNPQPVWVPNWGMTGAWRIGSPAAMGLSDRGDYWSATLDDETIRRYATAEAYGWGARAGCPYGQPRDRLWVRETTVNVEDFGYLGPVYAESDHGRNVLEYGLAPSEDDYTEVEPEDIKLRPSIFMQRAMCRIMLEIVSVRVERLQDINRGDAMAEGCPFPNMAQGDDPRRWYADLWERINGPGSWDANPWVWVVEFKRITA